MIPILAILIISVTYDLVTMNYWPIGKWLQIRRVVDLVETVDGFKEVLLLVLVDSVKVKWFLKALGCKHTSESITQASSSSSFNSTIVKNNFSVNLTGYGPSKNDFVWATRQQTLEREESSLFYQQHLISGSLGHTCYVIIKAMSAASDYHFMPIYSSSVTFNCTNLS